MRKEEAREEKEDEIWELKCEDVIGLSIFEPKFLSFRLVYIIGDQIKPDICEVFVWVDVPYSDVIKPTPPDDIFSKYVCTGMRKINLHNFENNFKSSVTNESYYTIRWATTFTGQCVIFFIGQCDCTAQEKWLLSVLSLSPTSIFLFFVYIYIYLFI